MVFDARKMSAGLFWKCAGTRRAGGELTAQLHALGRLHRPLHGRCRQGGYVLVHGVGSRGWPRSTRPHRRCRVVEQHGNPKGESMPPPISPKGFVFGGPPDKGRPLSSSEPR